MKISLCLHRDVILGFNHMLKIQLFSVFNQMLLSELFAQIKIPADFSTGIFSNHILYV